MKNFFFYPTKIAVGYGLFMFINNLVKITIYPYIVIEFQSIGLRFLLILLVSILVRLIMIFAYDKVKIDCFLIEMLKKNQLKNRVVILKENKITTKIKKLRAISKIALIIGLVFIDPVITVLYHRKGSFQWNGLSDNKTGCLFIVSNFLGALSVTLGISFIFYLFKKAGFF